MIRKNDLHRGKQRGYYDISSTELFMAELGREIMKHTEDKCHKTQMTDEDWNTYCDAANKCVRFGTLWGPKKMKDFKREELLIIKLFLDKRKKYEKMYVDE